MNQKLFTRLLALGSMGMLFSISVSSPSHGQQNNQTNRPLQHQPPQVMLSIHDATRPAQFASGQLRDLQKELSDLPDKLESLLFLQSFFFLPTNILTNDNNGLPILLRNYAAVDKPFLNLYDELFKAGLIYGGLMNFPAPQTQKQREMLRELTRRALDFILLDRQLYKKPPIAGLSLFSNPPDLSPITRAWLSAVVPNRTNLQGILNAQVKDIILPPQLNEWHLVVLNLLLFNDALRKNTKQDILSEIKVNLEVNEIIHDIKTIPENLISFHEYASFEENVQTYFGEFRYSNNIKRFDLAAQWFAGDLHGYGVQVLKDFSKPAEKLNKELSELEQDIQKARKQLLTPLDQTPSKDREADKATLIAKMLAQDEKMIKAVVDTYLNRRRSISLTYQHINDFGSILTLGLNTSRLFPSRRHQESDGISYALSLNASYFDLATGVPDASQRLAPSLGLVVAWQNKVPYTLESKVPYTSLPDSNFAPNVLDTRQDRVGHWSMQTGLLFSHYFETDPNSGSVVGGFVRYRDRKNFWEVSAQAGFNTHQRSYFTLGLAKAFP